MALEIVQNRGGRRDDAGGRGKPGDDLSAISAHLGGAADL